MNLRLVIPLVAMLAIAVPATAEGSKWRKAKRIFAISGCAAHAVDLYSTHRALSRPGFRESNPLLRGPNGGLRWSVALPTKAFVCAMPLIFDNPKLDRFWTIYGIGETGLFSGIAIRNARQ